MKEDLLGTILDAKFRVEAVIGAAHAGGMVYRGRHLATGAPVVLRCPAVPRDIAGEELDAALDAFLAEAALLTRIGESTDDVEKLLGAGVEVSTFGRVPFCAFEWLSGKSLQKELAGRPWSIGEAVAILEPAARALATAHAMGAAHKDVRPANLWLAEVDGRTRVKVAAFALATRVGKGASAFVPEYAAPEHFKSTYGAVGPATDVYGLALTIVEMISGKRALGTGRETDAGDFYIATSDLARRPTARARGAHVSDAIEAVLARALAVDPKRRYPNVREMWDALLAAAPELTPAPPSVAPAPSPPHMKPIGGETGLTSLASRPPGIVSTASLPPTSDARLSDHVKLTPAPPPVASAPAAKASDRSGAWAWIVVAVLGVAAIAAVVAKVGRTAPAPPPARPSASAAASAAPSASAAEAPIGIERVTDMVRVPATKFTMGSDKDDKPAKPAHEVDMTRAFYMDRTEVTADAYQRCVDEGSCSPSKVHGEGVQETTYGCNGKDKPLHPANCVDREQAAKYCKFAGKRLPTEAEWELAARGTDARDYPWGNAAPTSCAQAILTGMSGDCGDRKGTWEVGTTTDGKSPYGAFDMAGNVWEWVADGFAEYPSAAVIDPRVAPSPKGVLRGGSWDYATTSAKTTYRLTFPAASGNVSIGFRCARDD